MFTISSVLTGLTNTLSTSISTSSYIGRPNGSSPVLCLLIRVTVIPSIFIYLHHPVSLLSQTQRSQLFSFYKNTTAGVEKCSLHTIAQRGLRILRHGLFICWRHERTRNDINRY